MTIIINPIVATNPKIGVPAQSVVSFTDDAPGEIDVYYGAQAYTGYRQWDFGDGSVDHSNNASVSHMYSRNGNFTVMLKRADQTFYGEVHIQAPVTVLTFEITDINISPSKVGLNDWASITATVKNTSKSAGAATVRFKTESGTWIADVTTDPIPAGGTTTTNPLLSRVQGLTEGTIRICAELYV